MFRRHAERSKMADSVIDAGQQVSPLGRCAAPRLGFFSTSDKACSVYLHSAAPGVPVASVQETSIRASMGKAVEQNEGHFPRLSWAKTLGFLHV